MPEQIKAWVGFDFPGRQGKYSPMKYHHRHFNGVDWDESRKEHAIYKIASPHKSWSPDVSNEHGNYDYLMFANLDQSHPEVRADIFNWAEWIGTEFPLSGMRIDAAKHYSSAFQKDFVDHLHVHVDFSRGTVAFPTGSFILLKTERLRRSSSSCGS